MVPLIFLRSSGEGRCHLITVSRPVEGGSYASLVGALYLIWAKSSTSGQSVGL